MEDGSPIRYDIECAYCNDKPNIEGHDKCISNLKGVKNACCGHGNTNDCYVQLDTGKIYYGRKAEEVIRRIQIEEIQNNFMADWRQRQMGNSHKLIKSILEGKIVED